MLQVAEYRSNKEEARKAKVAQEQAELEAMHKKEAEEEVCLLVSCCTPPYWCAVQLMSMSRYGCVWHRPQETDGFCLLTLLRGDALPSILGSRRHLRSKAFNQ